MTTKRNDADRLSTANKYLAGEPMTAQNAPTLWDLIKLAYAEGDAEAAREARHQRLLTAIRNAKPTTTTDRRRIAGEAARRARQAQR